LFALWDEADQTDGLGSGNTSVVENFVEHFNKYGAHVTPKLFIEIMRKAIFSWALIGRKSVDHYMNFIDFQLRQQSHNWRAFRDVSHEKRF
jgi:hypothetical protein